MEFDFDVNKVLPSTITFVDYKRLPFSKHAKDVKSLRKQLDKIIDGLGAASSKAQSLQSVITTAAKLQLSDHELYILKDASANDGHGAAVGMIKVGRKTLFLLDNHGIQHEVVPLCVMDFYVHQSRQRNGCGKRLFEHMLKIHNLQPAQVAIDRPSPKFLSFLKKHYGLHNSISQPNKFLVFDQFFRDVNAVGHIPRQGQRSRSGNQLNSHPQVHPHRRNCENSGSQPASVQQFATRLSTRSCSRRDQPMNIDDNTEISKPILPSIPMSRKSSRDNMRSVGSGGSRESSARSTRGLAAQASLYSRHSSAGVARRHGSTANQLWGGNALSAGTRSLHACSEDNPMAIGQTFMPRRSNTVQLKPLGNTTSQAKTDSYTLSSIGSTLTKSKITGHGSSWDVFGIPRVDTSAKTAYQTNLSHSRTFPF